MEALANLRAQLQAALGQEPVDLLIRNVRLANVHMGRIIPTDIGVKHGRVVSLDPDSARQAAATFDAGGLYALPGFVDSHLHIETTLLTPPRLAEYIVPRGTTSIFADPMEIANVAGSDGLKALLTGADALPYRLFIQVPSRVPTAPGLETTGAALGLAEVEQLLDWEATASLGELDPAKVLGLSDEHLQKVQAARTRKKIANGHAIGLEGKELAAYAVAGLADDHECTTYGQLVQRLEAGIAVMIREGSSERNLSELIAGVVSDKLDTRHLMFCTDDKHPADIRAEGHINANVNEAIRIGLPPLEAIQMATLNAARHFRLDHEIGAIAPGRFADILLCTSLDRIEPERVYLGGTLVAASGSLVEEAPLIDYPNWLRNTVRVSRGKAASDFAVEAQGSRADVRFIEIVPDQITNFLRRASLPVVDGQIQPDPGQDLLKLAVVERYGKNGNVAVGWAKGFALKAGAMACSVAHDHHNILVVGARDSDMALCVRALLESQGGFVAAADGRVHSLLPLPLAGLMSDAPPKEVDAGLREVRGAARSLGCPLAAPFMTLSFISLPTVPEAGMSDLGLIDVRAGKLIPSVVGMH